VNTYAIVLFLHLAALLAAIGTAGIAHFAEARLRVAETVAVVRGWAALLNRVAPVFPLALLVLLASGAYLVHHDWTWSRGWIEIGLVGVALLFANGAGVVGRRNRALQRSLATAGDGPITDEVLHLTRRDVGGIASWANTGLAVGVVFVMTTKPGLAGSLSALAAAAAAGTLVAVWLRRPFGALKRPTHASEAPR
jgi:hypothetical protein